MNCECGCGSDAEAVTFLPGHDQRLRTALEARVGGLLALRDIVQAIEAYVQGRTSIEELGKVIRGAMWSK